VSVTGSKSGYFSATETSKAVAIPLCVHAASWAVGCLEPKTRVLSRAAGLTASSLSANSSTQPQAVEDVASGTDSDVAFSGARGVAAQFIRAR
jgi:hypothetical protein